MPHPDRLDVATGQEVLRSRLSAGGVRTPSRMRVAPVAGTRRSPEETRLDFERAVEDGREEQFLVGLIAEAAEKQWRAAAWLLERRFPSRWSVRRGENCPPEPEPLREDDPFEEVIALSERRRERKRDG